jgi:hypothetical protein
MLGSTRKASVTHVGRIDDTAHVLGERVQLCRLARDPVTARRLLDGLNSDEITHVASIVVGGVTVRLGVEQVRVLLAGIVERASDTPVPR